MKHRVFGIEIPVGHAGFLSSAARHLALPESMVQLMRIMAQAQEAVASGGPCRASLPHRGAPGPAVLGAVGHDSICEFTVNLLGQPKNIGFFKDLTYHRMITARPDALKSAWWVLQYNIRNPLHSSCPTL